jgi:hypothetical protein
MSVTINGTSGVTFNDSSSQTTAATGFGFKNRILNGQMQIDQRGSATTPVTTSAYATDRWNQASPVVSKISTQQSTTTTTGFSNSLASTVSSAYTPSASEVFRVYQRIEGNNCADLAFGSASAATVTLSFWVRSSVTGTYAVSLQNSAGNRSYVATYTVNAANTFEQKTITIAGDTSGTWLTTNGIGIQVAFCQQTGSNFQTTAGSWQAGEYYGVSGAASWLPTAGATMYITGVQLEKGSTATSFDYRPYGTELALCQRYYEITHVSFSGYGNGGSSLITSIPFKVTKRASPTVAFGADTGSWTTNFPTATANVFGADEVSVQTGASPTTGLSRYNATTTLTSEL